MSKCENMVVCKCNDVISRKESQVPKFVTQHILKCILLASFLFSLSSIASAQEERSLTREGNKYFDKQKYPDAEASYKKALEKKNNFPEAIFNLGDAMYKQGRYDDAAKQFQLAAKMLTDTLHKAEAYHNLGNCSLEKKEWEDAVKAYKEALKLNPRDKDTKYNLAYANAKLKDNKQNQKNKDQNKQNKDNKDDKKDQDKKDQDKKNQDQKDQKDKGDGDKKDQPKKGNGKELSKEQAEKLLEALKAEEQKTQEKMQKKMAKPQDAKIEKDW